MQFNEMDLNKATFIEKFSWACLVLFLGGLLSMPFNKFFSLLFYFLISRFSTFSSSIIGSTELALIGWIFLILFWLVFRSKISLFNKAILMVVFIHTSTGLMIDLFPALLMSFTIPIILTVLWFYLYKTKKPWIYYYVVFGLSLFSFIFSFLWLILVDIFRNLN